MNGNAKRPATAGPTRHRAPDTGEPVFLQAPPPRRQPAPRSQPRWSPGAWLRRWLKPFSAAPRLRHSH